MWKIAIFFLVVGATFAVTNAAGKDPMNAAIQDVFGPNFFQDNKTATFDWSIFKKVHSLGIKNSLMSPFSLKICMMLLYEAASGKTQDELKQAMDFIDSDDEIRKKYESLLKYIKTPKKTYELDIGTRMYLDSSISPAQKYQSIIKSSYDTQIAKLDVNNPYQGAKDANEWARNVTKGNIEYLVSEDDLRNVVILLLSGIYFKGSWETPFPPEDTLPATFYLNSTHTQTALMMRLNGRFDLYHSKQLQSKIIKLPFKGGDISMYIVLPDTINGLADLVSEINPMRLSRAMSLMEDTAVDILIPKFKFDYTSRLASLLQEMGIREIFENLASLPKLARGSGLTTKLSVSNILQKAGIEVNELGTTAYAATEISLVNKFGDDDNVEEFRAIRPFLFFLLEKVTNQILFVGTVEVPNDSKPTLIPIRPTKN